MRGAGYVEFQIGAGMIELTEFSTISGDRRGLRALLTVALAFVVVVSVLAAPDHAAALPEPVTTGDGSAASEGSVINRDSKPDVVERTRSPSAAAVARAGFTELSTGGDHACGLRTDGTLTCWGSDQFGQATPPTGSFTQVSSGVYHSCGLRADTTITCWGSDQFGRAAPSPPTGSFTQVSSGSAHSCGLRSGGSVECWGDNRLGQATALSGSFMSVSAGGYHSCALRTDGTITCWGHNDRGQATAPPGSFTQVSAGSAHSCALRTDATITCWGHNDRGQATPPRGWFIQVSSGVGSTGHSCGLRSGGSVVCWGFNRFGQATPPPGSFTQVSVGRNHSCGLRTDGTVTCWGDNQSGQATAPSGSFTQVSSGFGHSCGLRSGGSVVCWGDNNLGQATAPSGSFTQVSANSWHSCGLRTDATITCWGNNQSGQATPPAGSFTQVSAGGYHSCGLRTDATITCWSSNWSEWETTPSGSFTQVSAGIFHSCGLRSGGSVVCWGHNRYLRATPPAGSFTQVSAGWQNSCGLRGDGSVNCWDVGVVLPVGPGCGDGSVPAVASGRPGPVAGVGFELGEFGRNLFWSPTCGVSEYEVDARESGGDQADYQGGIACLYTLERCDYLLDEDRRTSEAFRAAPELRVRAVNESGAGPWSEWVSVGEEGPPGRVENLRYGWLSTEGLVLSWDPVPGADRYEVEGREAGRAPHSWWVSECGDQVCTFLADEAGSGIWEGVFTTATEFRVRAVKGRLRDTRNWLRSQWSDWLTVETGKPRKVRNVRSGVESRALTSSARDVVSWSPVRGAESYDLQYRYFKQVPLGNTRLSDDDASRIYEDAILVEDVARYGSEGCRGLSRCEYRSLRDRDDRMQVRVRAKNVSGAGPWSEWVESVRRPEGPPTISSLREVHHTSSHNDVEVDFWPASGAVVHYRLEWRYIEYQDDAGNAINADSNPDRVRAVVEWMDDPANYVVRKQGHSVVDAPLEGTAKGVLNDDAERWMLEFRVVAVGDDRESPSTWVRWNTQELKDELESSFACGALDVASAAWKVIGVVLALYSGGLGAGVLAALSTQIPALGPNGFTAVQALAGCFRDHHPLLVLKKLSPIVGVILELSGITPMVWKVTCGNYYIATRYKDKHFDVDDIDGLLEECYA